MGLSKVSSEDRDRTVNSRPSKRNIMAGTDLFRLSVLNGLRAGKEELRDDRSILLCFWGQGLVRLSSLDELQIFVVWKLVSRDKRAA